MQVEIKVSADTNNERDIKVIEQLLKLLSLIEEQTLDNEVNVSYTNENNGE